MPFFFTLSSKVLFLSSPSGVILPTTTAMMMKFTGRWECFFCHTMVVLFFKRKGKGLSLCVHCRFLRKRRASLLFWSTTTTWYTSTKTCKLSYTETHPHSLLSVMNSHDVLFAQQIWVKLLCGAKLEMHNEDQSHHMTWYSSETTRIYKGSTLKNGQFYMKEQYFAMFCHSLAQFKPDTFVWCLLSVIGQLWRHWPNITLMEVVLNQNAFSFCFFLEQTYN